jgi:hypothetical protein
MSDSACHSCLNKSIYHEFVHHVGLHIENIFEVLESLDDRSQSHFI